MTTTHCLNCEKELTDKFCAGCGQKADTHRISLKSFVFHDILHGTFHIDRGILYTARQALVRPGKAALDYIAGKRKPFYNVFYLILITIGLIIFLRHFIDVLDGPEIETVTNKPELNEASKTMNEIFDQKSKLIIFLFVPFAAFNSFLIFRRKKLNIAEHSIIAGMILLGMLLISALGNLFFYFELIAPFSSGFAWFMSWLVTLLIFIHIGYGYWNAFSKEYSKWGISYRIAFFFALISLEIYILLLIVIGFVTDWKFGRVTFSPFGY